MTARKSTAYPLSLLDSRIDWLKFWVRAVGFTIAPILLSEIAWLVRGRVASWGLTVLVPFLGYPIDLWWGKDQLFQRTTFYSWLFWWGVGLVTAGWTLKIPLRKAIWVFVMTGLTLSLSIHLTLRLLGYVSWFEGMK